MLFPHVGAKHGDRRPTLVRHAAAQAMVYSSPGVYRESDGWYPDHDLGEDMLGLWLAAIALMLIGLIGTIVPGIPGLPLVLAGGVLFAVGSGFAVVGPWQLT